jgi:hypothetical protein
MDEVVIKVEVNAVRLQQAVLCADCDVISDSPHDICLVCGSHSLLPLSRVLGKVSAVSVPAAHWMPDQQPGVPDNVLVLRSPMPHVRRHRGHS